MPLMILTVQAHLPLCFHSGVRRVRFVKRAPVKLRNPNSDESSALETAMTQMGSKNEMLVMVLTDLAGICKKLAENSAVPETLRLEFRKFGEEFDTLSPYRGKGTAAQHAQGELLLVKMARSLPRVLEVQAQPRADVA